MNSSGVRKSIWNNKLKDQWRSSLSPWDCDLLSGHSSFILNRERSFTEAHDQDYSTQLLPLFLEEQQRSNTHPQKSFVMRPNRLHTKLLIGRNRPLVNSDGILEAKNESCRKRKLKLIKDNQHLETRQTENQINSYSKLISVQNPERTLSVQKQNLKFKMVDLKLQMRVALVDVDKYLSEYKTREKLNQLFFKSYYNVNDDHRSPAHIINQIPADRRANFSRRNWRIRRGSEFYVI